MARQAVTVLIFNDVAYLIRQDLTTNEYGDTVAEETRRMVYVCVKSFGLKRKMEAEQLGLKLSRKFVLADQAEYEDESILEYNGERLNIVNAYIAEDRSVELQTARF